MKEVFGIFLPTFMGPGLLALGIWTLRSRAWREGVPLLELAIDRAIGEEPPERTARDRWFSHFNAWAQIIFGSFFTVCLVAVLFTLFASE